MFNIEIMARMLNILNISKEEKYDKQFLHSYIVMYMTVLYITLPNKAELQHYVTSFCW